jgi:hypothetical protein
MADSSPMFYTSGGSMRVTVVDGTALTGIMAADGSFNVVVVDGTELTGIYHACGGLNVIVPGAAVTGIYHPCGALYVSEEGSYIGGSVRVSVVSGSFGDSLTLTEDSVTREISPEFTFDYSLAINTGDIINLEIDSNIDFSTATQHDYTAVSDGLDAVTVDFPSIALTAGTWYARANVNGGAWSNTVTFIISPGMFGARHFGGRYFAANHIGG